jgi:hypothetical protein
MTGTNTASYKIPDTGEFSNMKLYCDMWAVCKQRLGKHCLNSRNNNEQAEVHC